MEQIFVSNLLLLQLPFLLLHHDVLDNWGSVFCIVFTHFLEDFTPIPMKV